MTRYVERDNEIVYRPPYLQSDAFLTAWFVKSSVEKQQAVLDQALNDVCGRKPYEYKAFLPHAAFVLARMGKVTSLDPRDAQRGWVPEVDVCFWILAAAYKDGKLDHFVWYIPYIWVDSPYTLVNGRESFGFPKSFATTKMPEGPSDRGPFYADALVLPTFTPETEVQSARIVDVEHVGPFGLEGEPLGDDRGESWRAIVKRLLEAAGGDVLAAEALTQELLTAKIPIVYLKQFRDCVEPTAACYQAIIESDTSIRSFGGAGFLPLGWKIRLRPYASVDVGAHLGIDNESDVLFGFWARMNFSVDLGKVVYEAK